MNPLSYEIMLRSNRVTFDSSANLFPCNSDTYLHVEIEIFGQKLTAKPPPSFLSPGEEIELGFLIHSRPRIIMTQFLWT